jgi:uncharacterized protein YigA (DUF484 family)
LCFYHVGLRDNAANPTYKLMANSQGKRMREEDVAAYLAMYPKFFETHAHLLTDVVIPHPHGGRAISIGERQVIALRDKVRLLETKLAELIHFGEDNDALAEKVHRITLALMMSRSLESLLHSIYLNLREDFAVPHMTLRLWSDGGSHADLKEFSPISNELRIYAENLINPFCGPHVVRDVAGWFGEDADRLRSYALVTLRAETSFGLLVLASEDAQRFYPEMGTLYLKRLGELISMALARFLGKE